MHINVLAVCVRLHMQMLKSEEIPIDFYYFGFAML